MLKPTSPNLSPEALPDVQRLLAESRIRPTHAMPRRELLNELLIGGGFLLAAVLLVALLPTDRAWSWTDAAIAFVSLLLGARVVFEVGSCYTMPTQLGFVPALFLLPPETVPLTVAAAFAVSKLFDVPLRGRRPARVLLAPGDAWFAIGPALVLAADGGPAADSVAWTVLVAALAAQFVGESLVSRLREWLHDGATFREQVAESAWVYLVDALLSPLGFALALASVVVSWAALLALPLYLLLLVFARERDARLTSLLELSEAYRGTAAVLSDVVRHDDSYTGIHTASVAALAVEVANEIGLDPVRRRHVEFGALLHDVGKIAIPKQIINKPGPLDDREWEVIKTHTIEGQQMLDRIGGLMSTIGRVVRSSHERFDGDGYPDGLASDEIPIESRIVFCCDAFNAITTDRPYRRARTVAEAVEELRANAGSQFDPDVVEALVGRVAAGAV